MSLYSIVHGVGPAVLALLALSMPVNSAPIRPIGYGSSDAVLPRAGEELFFLGFEAGFEAYVPHGRLADWVVTENSYDGSQLGAVRVAKALEAKQVSMLVGFPTSHEALLAAKVAVQADLIAIFAAAGHADLATMGPYILTTGESMEYSVSATLKFVTDRYPGHTGFLVINPFAVFSKNQEETLQKLKMEGKFRDANLDVLYLTRELAINPADIQRLKAVRGASYLYVTTYPDDSRSLLEQLEKEKLDIPVVTNSSWTTGDIEFIRRFLTKRASPVFSSALWMKDIPVSGPFEQLIQKRYGRSPTQEIAHGYDVGVITAELLRRTGDAPSKAALKQALDENRCFSGTSTGTLCFTKSGGHSTRHLIFVQFEKNGFVRVPSNK